MTFRLAILLLWVTSLAFGEWAHLELGAGNYGADGHTKLACSKTVLMKIKVLSDEKNFIDTLEEAGRGDYKPEEQYGVLFWTLDELVKRHGDVGIFHVNDLYGEYATFAAEKLQEYALRQGYHSTVIEAIPGDYQLIDPKQTLSSYGKTRYSTAHLKNPEVSLYYDQMDGNDLYTSEDSRDQARLLLQNLANLSESGLYLFILDHKNFIPPEEKSTFMQQGIFYHATTEWDAVPYIFPEGDIMKMDSIVFQIFPKGTQTFSFSNR